MRKLAINLTFRDFPPGSRANQEAVDEIAQEFSDAAARAVGVSEAASGTYHGPSADYSG